MHPTGHPYLYDLSVYGKDVKTPSVQIKSQRPDRKDAPQNIRTPWNVNVKLSQQPKAVEPTAGKKLV